MLNILKKLRKSSDTFGLDIGTSAVKAVQIKSGSVTGMASVGLPADTIADGSIRDTQAVADAIKEAVVKAGIEGLEAAIAVCGRELIIKKVQIPEVPARDVHDVGPRHPCYEPAQQGMGQGVMLDQFTEPVQVGLLSGRSSGDTQA